MKKILLKSALFAAFAMMVTGCLKDKGFEDHEYGINDPDASPAGIGFPLGSKAANIVGIEVSGNPQIISTEPVITLFSGDPAPSDINITLTLNPGLVAAYNAANSTNVLDLPTNLYSFQTLNVVLPAGERMVKVPMTITSSTSLDPTKAYGVGLTISSADAGYTIAENFKNLLLIFNIKNKYDGIYKLYGFHNRPGLDAPYKNITVHMVTTGPDKVKMYWPALGADAHPINGGSSYYGNFTTEFKFALSSASVNPLIAIDNPYTPGSPAFTIVPGSNSRWVDTVINGSATKVIFAQYYYANNPTQRGFSDTLYYSGPR